MYTTGCGKVDEIIDQHCRDNTRHVMTGVTFLEILDRVWQRINYPDKYREQWINGIRPDTQSMMECFKQEMLKSEGMCFIGVITRLVNCLSGFYADINITISENEQMSARIIHLLNHRGDDSIEIIREKARNLLMEICDNPDTISIWVNSIN